MGEKHLSRSFKEQANLVEIDQRIAAIYFATLIGLGTCNKVFPSEAIQIICDVGVGGFIASLCILAENQSGLLEIVLGKLLQIAFKEFGITEENEPGDSQRDKPDMINIDS